MGTVIKKEFWTVEQIFKFVVMQTKEEVYADKRDGNSRVALQ